MDTSSLYGEFRNHFDLFWANTPELLEQAHRIRYAVYCREFRHERAEDYPDGLERDAYDPHAQHLLARHKASGLGAGCVRIIQPPPDDPHFLLPLERHCGRSFDHALVHPGKVARAELVEISRLAVHPSFRRRRGEFASPTGAASRDDADPERRTFPLLGAVLMIGAMALSELFRRPHGFAMMEPRLARFLRIAGLPFAQVGALMDYHGQRAAYHLTVADFLHSGNRETLRMYRFIQETLRQRAAREGFSRV